MPPYFKRCPSLRHEPSENRQHRDGSLRSCPGVAAVDKRVTGWRSDRARSHDRIQSPTLSGTIRGAHACLHLGGALSCTITLA